MTQHRTPGEKRTAEAAAAAVARAQARATPPPEPEPGAPYISPAQARLIRLRIESERTS